MADQDKYIKSAADTIVREVRRRQQSQDRPFLIAIDGGSGSGKSCVASVVAEELGAVLVPGDDFFSADITDDGWAERGPEGRAGDGINWRHLRSEVLEPLLSGKPARWNAFDFVSGTRPDGTYRMLTDFVERAPAGVIILDGTYSARPELADLIDLSVLVDVPVAVRHQRLSEREENKFLDAWHARWDGAEEHYFTHVRPPSSFDLVVKNDASAGSVAAPHYSVTDNMVENLRHYVEAWDLSQPRLLTTTATSHIYIVRSGSSPAVLKLLTPVGIKDETGGAVALRCFDGNGSVRLFRREEGAQLLEYAAGEALKSVVAKGRDDEATTIIADVLNQLHSACKRVPPHGLTPLSIWFRSLFTKAEVDFEKDAYPVTATTFR